MASSLLDVAKEPKKKRFCRYKDGAELYSMGLTKFKELAREAGAVYRVGGLILVNMDMLERYLEIFRL